MNDIEDWLNSLSTPTNPTTQSNSEEDSTPSADAESPSESASLYRLSENDIEDVLDNLGFQSENEREEEEQEEEVEPSGPWHIEPAPFDEPSDEEDNISTTSEESTNRQSNNIEAPVATEETPSERDLLPENSPTLLMDDATSRFSGTEWFDEIQKARVIIAGIGGIGSNVAFQLSRLSPERIVLYDPDVVETVNMSGQLFSVQDIGNFKTEAITSMMRSYTSMHTSIYSISEEYTSASQPGDIMICGFDNMAARKTFFDSWHDHMLQYRTTQERAKCLFLDGRLSIDTLQVLCITGDNEYACDRYRNEFLFSDAEADETICSMKQTTYLACMIGSIMVNLFTNFIAGQLDPVIPYDLPFFTQYESQHMLFKTES